MSIRSILAVGLAPAFAGVLAAQAAPAPDPQTLADCLKAAREYPGQQYKALRAAGQTPNYADLTKQKVELARRWAARFPL